MKKIWKLIFKCICVMLPFILFSVYACGNFVSFADEESPYYFWNKEFTRTRHEKKYDVVILGDSVANASYAPELLSDTTVNLAMGGMTPVENYYVFSDWLEHNEAPDHVFISFQDLHLSMSDCFWSRAMFMHRFDMDQNWEMLMKAAEYEEETVAVDGYLGDFVEYQFFLPTKYVTAFMKASFNQRLEKNVTRKAATDLHRGWYMGRSTMVQPENEIHPEDEYVVKPLYDYYYRQILDLCRENEISVHIIRLPLSDLTTFEDSYVEQINAYYEELTGDYEDVSFDWYSEPYKKEQFMDYVHMNMRGTLEFSLFLKKEWAQCFGDEKASAGQMLAINDSMREENDMEGLFGWASGGDYTAVIYDKSGRAPKALEEAMEKYGLSMKESEEALEEGVVYVVTPSGVETEVSKKAVDAALAGVPSEEAGMTIVVWDNCHDELAVQKNYGYEKGFVAR